MRLPLTTCLVRSWRLSDAEALVSYGNNRKIWLNLRDRFPHPYTKRDALEFLRSIVGRDPETVFAVTLADQAIGSVGFVLQHDVERVSAEIGYWLGEPFWGRGIATEALSAVTKYAIERHGLTRLFAVPFASNRASCRVLEKAGYHLEGRLRRSAIKDGVVVDQCQYAFVVSPASELQSAQPRILGS
jgi:ribosomal-protein-alanine N-acetyltransferase